MDIGLKLKGSYLDCTTEPVYGWFQDCTTNNWMVTMGDVTEYNSETTCDAPYQEMVGTQTQCVVVNNGDVDDSSGSPGGYSPPVVDATDLQQNPKADCIYQKLISGSILQNLIDRYNAPSQPEHAFLGELNLTWKLGERTETIPIGMQNNGSYYSVEIILDETVLNAISATNVALSMLHEALHAKLIAQVYDETGTTDFVKLYAYYKGWGMGDIDHQQEVEMIQNYADEMAVALREFDQTQGIEHDLNFYKEALKYTFSVDLRLSTYKAGEKMYSELYYSSKKCH